MTTEAKHHRRRGWAWTEDWKFRLYERVQERSFSTVTEFVESRPGVSLLELANELGPAVAAVQIEWRLVAEAEANGTIERCARSLLVRELRHALPEGWQRKWVDVPGDPNTPMFRKVGAFVDMIVALPESYSERARRVCKAFDAADIPEGWLPASADDPILVDIFSRYWSDPE